MFVVIFPLVSPATSLGGVMVPNHLKLFWQSQCPAWLNCTYVCADTHTHTQFDKVLKGGCRVLVAQSYGVWSSGKYPTHTLNNGDGERETADLEEQILVFTGPGGFTCSALFLFQTRYICVVEDAACFGSFSLTQSLSCLNLLAS